MILQDVFAEYTFIILIFFFVLFFLLVFFYISRFRRFSINEYIIHLRRGKVKRIGIGGTVVKLLFLDEIIVLPATIQSTVLEIFENYKITIIVLWRIDDPETAFSSLSWNIKQLNYINSIIKNLGESYLGKIYLGLKFHEIREKEEAITENLRNKLKEVVKKWGIDINEVKIKSFERI